MSDANNVGGSVSPHLGGGGSATDAGIEYQRAVAAYVVAFGISGLPLFGFGASAVDDLVEKVSIETEHVVDVNADRKQPH